MTVAILLGAPGAGKGTQAPLLAASLGVPVLASGDLLRAEVASGSDIGHEVDTIMRAGELVPDELMARLFLARLDREDAREGAILDGFPRTRVQAKALDTALAEAGRRVDAAILVDVPTEDLIARMASRRICVANGHVYNLASNPPLVGGICDLDGSELVQREDDREETVRSRLGIYQAQTRPLIEYYTKWAATGDSRAPRVQRISGIGTVDEIRERALAALA